MEPIEEQVRNVVEDIPGVSVLLVFGSRARGKNRPGSDLDVAVLPRPEEGGESEQLFRHRLQKRLAVALADLAPEGRVDVVFLDEAPDTLRQRVMEEGRMVLCRDQDAWKVLRIRTMKEYGDRQWWRRLYRRELRRRLMEGRPSGRSARARQPLERARGLSGEAREL
ncbi:MAG: type VII toxin-antitoxin system MntA family adenylyltransferase antitoxin [bacterium]